MKQKNVRMLEWHRKMAPSHARVALLVQYELLRREERRNDQPQAVCPAQTDDRVAFGSRGAGLCNSHPRVSSSQVVTTMDGSEATVIVFDAGSREFRAGFSGEDGPVECLPASTTFAAALEALEVEAEEVAIVISEKPGTSAETREATAQALFSLGVPELYISVAPLLAIYHTGVETGVAVDVGEKLTTILPLLCGHALVDVGVTVPLGGAHLPDSRDDCSGLFEPDACVAAAGAVGVHEAVLRTVAMCDASMRGALLGNVVLTGGGTLLPGFSERLHRELTAALEAARAPFTAKVVARGDRRIATWLGGATFGAMATGRAQLISRAAAAADPRTLHRPWTRLSVVPLAELEQHVRDAAEADASRHAARDGWDASWRAAAAAEFWCAMAPEQSAEESRRRRHIQQHLVLAYWTSRARAHLTRAGAGVHAQAAAAAAHVAAPPVVEMGAVAAMAQLAALFTVDDAVIAGAADDDETLCRRVRQRLQAKWASEIMDIVSATGGDEATVVAPHPNIRRLRSRIVFARWTEAALARTALARRYDAAYEHWALTAFRRALQRWGHAWAGACLRVYAEEQSARMRQQSACAAWRRHGTLRQHTRRANHEAAQRLGPARLCRALRAWLGAAGVQLAWRAVARSKRRAFACWRCRRRWIEWYVRHRTAARVLTRARRFFCGWRLLHALRACGLRAQRASLVSALASARATACRLERCKAGWRHWRSQLAERHTADEARWRACRRGALRQAVRAWRRWRQQQRHHMHASIVASGRHKRRAWLFVCARVGDYMEAQRSIRVARGACRTWLRRRGLRRWSRAADLQRRRHARAAKCATAFATAAHALRCTCGFEALRREWIVMRRALRAKSSVQQTLIAEAQQRLSLHRRGWRRLVERMASSRSAFRVERLRRHSVALSRARMKLWALRTWADSPAMAEYRRWKHQERVLQKVNDMLASDVYAASPTRTSDGGVGDWGGGAGNAPPPVAAAQHPDAASALAVVLDSHRTSLHVMRRLVSTWPSPPRESQYGRDASPPTGACPMEERPATAQQHGAPPYGPQQHGAAVPPPSGGAARVSAALDHVPHVPPYVPGSAAVRAHLGLLGQQSSSPAPPPPPPGSQAASRPPGGSSRSTTPAPAHAPLATPDTRRRPVGGSYSARCAGSSTAHAAAAPLTASAAVDLITRGPGSTEHGRAGAWRGAAASRPQPPRWQSVADGSLFSQIRQDLEVTSDTVRQIMEQRAAQRISAAGYRSAGE